MKKPDPLPPLVRARLELDGFLAQHKDQLPEDLRSTGLLLQDFLRNGCRQGWVFLNNKWMPAGAHLPFIIQLTFLYIQDGHRLKCY